MQGQYLAPIGSRAVLKTRSTAVTKDELFSLEDSLPQASFVAASNARYVSVKQGRGNGNCRPCPYSREVCSLKHGPIWSCCSSVGFVVAGISYSANRLLKAKHLISPSLFCQT